jgi:hypothetical protein
MKSYSVIVDKPAQLCSTEPYCSFLNSQSRCHPLSKFTRPPPPAFPFIPNSCGALGIEALFPHGLLESLSRVTQRPRHALVDLWLSTRLHGKLGWMAIRDGCGPNEDSTDNDKRPTWHEHNVEYGKYAVWADARCEPVDRLDAACLAAGEEAVHPHGASCRVCARGMAVPGPGLRPGDVAVCVVLEFEGGCLCVRLCFEEGASGLRALGERGGEEGGEWVREEGVHFWSVQYWLGPRTTTLSAFCVGRGEERGRNADREGVVEDEYDYAVRAMSLVMSCLRRDVKRGRVEKHVRRHEHLVPGEKGVEDAEEGQFVLVLRKADLCDVSANNQRNVRWEIVPPRTLPVS